MGWFWETTLYNMGLTTLEMNMKTFPVMMEIGGPRVSCIKYLITLGILEIEEGKGSGQQGEKVVD